MTGNRRSVSAIVAHGPASAALWRLEQVSPRKLKEDEVLVRMVASGICLADVHFGNVAEGSNPAIYYPRILGHEGSGYVEEVGKSVTSVKPQDPVLLSFASCGQCYACADDHPAYCLAAADLNFMAQKGVYRTQHSEDYLIGASFFGQSSFSSIAVVRERSVVNLQGVVRDVEELRKFAPLGCGVQTGTGAMINVAGVKSGQDVVIIGAGSVGLSAIMASRMLECNKIIAIDRTSQRLELAKSLGATHVINTSETSDLVTKVLQITHGVGVHASLDTTGVKELARQSYDLVRNQGKVLEVGLAGPDDTWGISMIDLMNSGKQILGCVQGDANPQSYALDMIQWHRNGNLPIEKIIKFYNARNFEQALQDMHLGKTVKPILLWPQDSGEVDQQAHL